jgi:hypothetical protein
MAKKAAMKSAAATSDLKIDLIWPELVRLSEFRRKNGDKLNEQAKTLQARWPAGGRRVIIEARYQRILTKKNDVKQKKHARNRGNRRHHISSDLAAGKCADKAKRIGVIAIRMHQFVQRRIDRERAKDNHQGDSGGGRDCSGSPAKAQTNTKSPHSLIKAKHDPGPKASALKCESNTSPLEKLS